MAKSIRTKRTGDNIPQENKKPLKPRRKRMTAKERVRVHIEDEKDIITDQDLKDVKLELGLPTDEKPLEIKNDAERPKDEGKDKPHVTPWDVLNE